MTAASIGKHGGRSFAGPFDWIWSDFEQVMCCIENNFEDFLKKENIIVDNRTATNFEDCKYKMYFFHDVKHNFDAEYEIVYSKYQRRIKRFKEETKQRTCYIRLVKNQQEINYILENEKHIRDIIKRDNEESDLLLLAPNFLRRRIETFQCF